MMKTELTVGIEGTKIKAGVIKLASSKDCITPMEEIFFKAAARAQRETGCVIITHTQEGTLGPEQAKLLIQNGADPWKIAIGHMCGNLNISYHEAVLKTGVYDNIDRFGLEGELFHTPTDDERVNLVTQLIARGYCERLLLAHDSVTVNLGRPMNMGKEMKEAMEHANIGNIGKRIIPMLMKNGITSSQIDTMLKTNPSRLFC
jgi:phosphotriesterase-related protein